MKSYEIVDKNYDKTTGELQSFLLIWDDGEPEIKSATPQNYLLYIDELYGFLDGDEALVFDDNGTRISVLRADSNTSYYLSIDNTTVIVDGRRAERLLTGIKAARERGVYSMLRAVHEQVLKTQVRQHIINLLYDTFEEDDRRRISISDTGWVIDEYYFLDWSASIYSKEDDIEEPDYTRVNNEAVKSDRSYQLVQLRHNSDMDDVRVSINGESYELTEIEITFLSKARWLLDRHEYHPDVPFWMYMKNRHE